MQVYYFTRTKRSEIIAQKIAENIGGSAHEIKDEENWDGPVNYVRGGYMSAKQLTVPIEYTKPENDKVILVFPLWANSFPPAVRTFINEVKKENIIAVPTSLATRLKDREDFVGVIDLVGKEITAPEKDEILSLIK